MPCLFGFCCARPSFSSEEGEDEVGETAAGNSLTIFAKGAETPKVRPGFSSN